MYLYFLGPRQENHIDHWLSKDTLVMALIFSMSRVGSTEAHPLASTVIKHSKICRWDWGHCGDCATLLLVQVSLDGHMPPAAQVGGVGGVSRSLRKLCKTRAAGAHVVHRFL